MPLTPVHSSAVPNDLRQYWLTTYPPSLRRFTSDAASFKEIAYTPSSVRYSMFSSPLTLRAIQ